MIQSLSNIMTIVSVVSIVITAVVLIRTICDVRSDKRRAKLISNITESSLSEYEQILDATKDLESQREKNNGDHFEDESVYLNRAQLIRKKTPFFSWVK